MLVNNTTTRTLQLRPEEYFQLETGEKASIDSFPKYDQPYRYITEDKSSLMMLQLVVAWGSQQKTIRQSFWDNGSCFITERTETGENDYYYREIVLCTGGESEETMRFVMKGPYIYPTLHTQYKVSGPNKEQVFSKKLEPFTSLLYKQREE